MTTDRLYEPRAVREGMGWDTVAYLLELDQVGRSVREGEGILAPWLWWWW